MIGYLVRRVGNYIVLLFVAISLSYCLASSQLHPRQNYTMKQPPLPPELVEAQLREYNISDQVPLWDRYVRWLTGIVTRWDWGLSPVGASVNDEIGTRMWVSLRLLLLGSILGIVIGVAIGAWTATRQYRLPDRTFTVLALLIISTPAFVLGHVSTILATQVNRTLGFQLFEFNGETGSTGGYPLAWLVDRAQHLFLPTVVLLLLGAASMSRIQRNLMLDALGSDFVRTARAKGLSQRRAITKHALRTALIPTGTYVAFTIATMFVGATFTERIFNFRGMGMYGVDTINYQDIHGVVAVTAFAGVCVLVGATLSDIFVAILDPRVRLS